MTKIEDDAIVFENNIVARAQNRSSLVGLSKYPSVTASENKPLPLAVSVDRTYIM